MPTVTTAAAAAAGTAPGGTAARTPVYFVSHGGPNVMFETAHPAYAELQKIGREITQTVKPSAVVVFSAHWQASPGRGSGNKGRVEVSDCVGGDLIYDYYGFPDHYYEVRYPHAGSAPLAKKITELLGNAGIDAHSATRGIDHGVFAPFTLFHPQDNPLGVPLVQVSLFAAEDPDQHFQLGAALQPLRDEGVVIIGSGMAVHNLRDFRFARMSGQEMPYAKAFDKELHKAVVEPASAGERKRVLSELLAHKSARLAHPTFEHLLPVHIAAGAAGDDKAVRLFTLTEASMSWAQFRFGDV